MRTLFGILLAFFMVMPAAVWSATQKSPILGAFVTEQWGADYRTTITITSVNGSVVRGRIQGRKGTPPDKPGPAFNNPVTGTFNGNQLHLDLSSGSTYDLSLSGDSLQGTYKGSIPVTFTRK